MTRIMGILNVTPDSFSDGGQFFSMDAALKQVEIMITDGVDIIDIGGESTRPNASPVSSDEELKRVIPVVKAINKHFDIPLSVDTSKPLVMQAAIDEGVAMINDVNALQTDGAMEVIANSTVDICLMHKKGEPKMMQKSPFYRDVVEEVTIFFKQRIDACECAGIDFKKIILDPGIGFGKTLQHNLQLLNQLDCFLDYGLPLLVGVSRKSMIGDILDNRSSDKRLLGSVSAALFSIHKGAKIIRVHDVKATADAIRVWESLAYFEITNPINH